MVSLATRSRVVNRAYGFPVAAATAQKEHALHLSAAEGFPKAARL